MSDTPIHDRLKGQTIHSVATDGRDLVVVLKTGVSVRVRWVDGKPIFAGQDVRLALGGGRAA